MFIRRAGDLGALVRDRRKAAGLTQAQFAVRIGTSQRWVSELERGKPTAELDMALRALNALGVTLTVDVPAQATSAVPAKPGRGKLQTATTSSVRPRVNVNDLVDE